MRHALHHGPFGSAVCDLLAGDGWDSRPWPGPADLPTPAGPGVSLVVAAGRDLAADLDAVDAAAHRSGYPWLPIVHDHPHVRVGPLVVPGAGPCLRCYHLRADQHLGEPDAMLRAVRAADLAPAGHLSGHAAIGAALARVLLAGAWPPGTVGRWHVVSQELSVDRVVGVHHCPRCGIPREPTDRAFAADGAYVGSPA